MHDPMTVAFEIRYPWVKSRITFKSGRVHEFREPFLTIWHVDPETDGSDDSCDWFGRYRPLNERESALLHAADNLLHRLGNPPYYPDPRLWGTDPHGDDPQEHGLVGDLHRTLNGWRRRGRRLHPRWHIWHWRIQVHPWRKLRRLLFERCGHCGERFGWDEAPVTYSWAGRGPLFHSDCTDGYEKKVAIDGLLKSVKQPTP